MLRLPASSAGQLHSIKAKHHAFGRCCQGGEEGDEASVGREKIPNLLIQIKKTSVKHSNYFYFIFL